MYSSHAIYFHKLIFFTVLALIFIVVLTSCKTASIVATQAIQQGDIANNQNDYEAAIIHYSAYLEAAPSLGTMRNELMEASVCRNLAHAYSTQGKYGDALDYLNIALATDHSQPDNDLNIIDDYRQLGLTNIYLGNYNSALSFLDSALDLNAGMESSIKAIKRLSIADTYLSKAQLELSMGLFTNAMEDVENARIIYQKEEPDGVGIIESYLLLANLYIAQNNVVDAIVMIEKSYSLALSNDYGVFRQLQVKADINSTLGKPEEVLLVREEALREAENTNIKPQIIWANLRLGDAYRDLGNNRKAREYYRKAKNLQKEIDINSALAPSLKMRLGDVKKAYDLFNEQGSLIGANVAVLNYVENAISEGQTDSLEVELREALLYFNQQSIKEGSAKSHLLLSILYQKQGQLDLALKELEYAENLSPLNNTLWKVWYNRSLVFIQQGDLDRGENLLVKSIELIEKERSSISRSEFKWHYLDDKTAVYDTYINLLLDQNNISQANIIRAFNLNESARSRTFLDMLASQNLNLDDEKIQQEQAILVERAFLSNLKEKSLLKGLDITDIDSKLYALNVRLLDIENGLQSTNPKYYSLNQINLVEYENLIKSIDADAAILEFWVGESKLVGWIITDHGISFSTIELSRSDVSKLVSGVRNYIKFGIEDKVVASFNELYSALSPIFQNVFDEYENVTIVPHGSLHFIPFEALFDGNKFLVEKSILRYSPSASVYYELSLNAGSKDNNKLLGLALGQLELGSHDKLPGTRMELSQLSQFYEDNTCIYENDISESYFKEHSDDFGVIHIATHGVMNRTKPGKSYILLAPSDKDDGQLTVNEIFNLDLSARVIALSACETGLGDLSEGDELIGLSRAFIYAGADAVIVSLWKSR